MLSNYSNPNEQEPMEEVCKKCPSGPKVAASRTSSAGCNHVKFPHCICSKAHANPIAVCKIPTFFSS